MQAVKKSRPASFAAVFAVYLLAFLLGLFLYHAFPLAPPLRLLIADAGATVLTFLFSVLFHNASVYDPYWSAAPPAILLALLPGKALTPLRAVLLALVLFWGVRLTANWAVNFRNLESEDWRYRMLREKTGRLYPAVNFFGIHLVPTLIVYLCVLPTAAAFWEESAWTALSLPFALLSFGAVFLELIPDLQMRRHRREHPGELIRTGLWKYARHPNYLGEILFWWGIALAVLPAFPGRWEFLSGAAVNTLLFLFVSIPMAEDRQSRKPGYAAYKRETRMLLPLPKRPGKRGA